MKTNNSIWDWKNGRAMSKEDLNITIGIVERDFNAFQTAIKECRSSQIADHVINIESEKVKLGDLEKRLSYYKALSHETV